MYLPFSLSKLENCEIFVIFHSFSLPSLFWSFKLLEWFIINLETFSACRELNFIVFRHKNYSNPIIFTQDIKNRREQAFRAVLWQHLLKKSSSEWPNMLSWMYGDSIRTLQCCHQLWPPLPHGQNATFETIHWSNKCL